MNQLYGQMTRRQASFEAFVNANLDSLLRTAFLITLDPEEAEDLVQESLFKVARQWPRVKSMREPVAFTRRVLINLAIDDARRRARRRVELDDVVADVGSDSPEFARLEFNTSGAGPVCSGMQSDRQLDVLQHHP